MAPLFCSIPFQPIIPINRAVSYLPKLERSIQTPDIPVRLTHATQISITCKRTMQNINPTRHKPTKPQNQKSIFSYNVYRSSNDHRPAPFHLKAASTGNTLWHDSEVLYMNDKVLHPSKSKECSTQTSKTIIQLAKFETGHMSPDSLMTTPRPNPPQKCNYTLSKCPSDVSVDGSCHERTVELFARELVGTTPNKRTLEKPLKQTFLEKSQHKTNAPPPLIFPKEESNRPNSSRSKSFVDSYYHPNFIRDNQTPDDKVSKLPVRSFVKPLKLARRSSKSLNLPDNSYPGKASTTMTYAPQNYLNPTTASEIKSNKHDIQSVHYLIPAMRRGRSTSPKPTEDHRARFECSKKIPYIDQSKSGASSTTTLVNTSRQPELARGRKSNTLFSEDLLNLGDVSGKTSEEILSTASHSNVSIDNAICVAVEKFREPDWRIALRGLAEIVELCRILDVDLIYDHMISINQRLIENLKSPRSHVCRTACQAAGHLFEYVKDTRRPEFDDIVDILLFKTADANKFIRQDANLALDCMVTHISSFNAVRALCAKGPFHKNHLVRCATARLLVCSIVIAGPEFVLNPNNNEYTRKRIIWNMARFLEDKNLETRKFGERVYKVLCKESRFDVYLKKYLEKDQITKIKKTLKLIHKK